MAFSTALYELLTKEFSSALKNGYAAPNIPERKLNGSIKGVAKNKVEPEDVLLIQDTTLFGKADNGSLFTKDSLFNYELLSTAYEFKLADISEIKHVHTETKDKNGKVKTSDTVLVKTNSGDSISFSDTYLKSCSTFVDWLQHVCDAARARSGETPYFHPELFANQVQDQSTEEPKVTNRPLEEMSVEVKIAYLKVISNYLLSDDGQVDPQELAQYYALVSRVALSPEDRFALYQYQNGQQLEDTQALVKTMTHDLDPIATDAVILSLTKDMIYIGVKIKPDFDYADHPFIKAFAQANKVSKEQLKFIKESIDNDNKLFDDNVDDNGLSSGYRAIAQGAATLGIPLAALYFSGSVVGLSAAGISSGLATLGFGGLFGASSMVTGIGALILLGVGANKGVKILTGQNEIDKRERKQALLFAINRNLQKTINMLVEDINTFTRKLNEEIVKTESLEHDYAGAMEMVANIKKRLESMQIYTKGCTYLSAESEYAELTAYRQKLPLKLDINRLESLTDEPTLKKVYKAIVNFYESKETKNSSGEKVTEYTLRHDLSRDEAEVLSKLLEKIGYFSASSLAKQGLHSLKNKLFS